MHETMVAKSLFDAIMGEMADRDGKVVLARISCGQLHAINEDILCFAFEAISKGTACEGLKLEIEQKPLQAMCEKCGEIFNVMDKPECSSCGSGDFILKQDAPLLLEEIEIETE